MEIIKKFNDLVDIYFKEEHNISFYEKKLDLKSKYLSKLSKKHNTAPPCQVLINKQIEFSKQLLKNTQKTIKEIAIEMNFEDQYYFSKLFKNKTGVSPSEFRRTKE
ncbi:helix-turn-helix transcriptional regulator [uncultured Kordia sp.]|uniref:helix-turn-helix domain-containing protein n=1 Tax=uncultured Kordia sp. TaxID=507699 RepID=UPI00262717BA|nr:helix-turn-helix transcriptional regulator [uncultured Kordia sp.]